MCFNSDFDELVLKAVKTHSLIYYPSITLLNVSYRTDCMYDFSKFSTKIIKRICFVFSPNTQNSGAVWSRKLLIISLNSTIINKLLKLSPKAIRFKTSIMRIRRWARRAIDLETLKCSDSAFSSFHN